MPPGVPRPSGRPYEGATAALATRHGKQELVAAAFAELGLAVVVADVDTDRFGTFSGEVERPGPAPSVAESKARAAIAASGLPLGLGSEGTFLPHPEAPGLHVDTELVAFVDADPPLVVVGRAVAAVASVASALVGSDEDVERFCARVDFPRQGLVVKALDGGTGTVVAKGIVAPDELRRALELARSLGDGASARLESDLRAHLCPPRRPVIAAAAVDLSRRLAERCGECAAPGFGLLEVRPGLPCSHCGSPTDLPREEVRACVRCPHRTVTSLPGSADPSRCPRCNP